MADEIAPELKAALTKGVIIDLVLIGVGFALWWVTQEVYWIVGAFVLSSTVFMLLLAQAGAFTPRK